MTCVRLLIRAASLLALATCVWGTGGVAFGQGLNPNPLQPAGVGSSSDVDMARGDQERGGPLGRGIGRVGLGEENPADTLLREMNGTNNGRRRGRYAISDPRRRTTGYRSVGGKAEGTAVRFDTRGAYEEAIYGTRRGSYTNVTRRRSVR
jgi:hypothetical protein